MRYRRWDLCCAWNRHGCAGDELGGPGLDLMEARGRSDVVELDDLGLYLMWKGSGPQAVA